MTDPRDPALAYLEGLERIARQGRNDPLERLLLARIQGSGEAVEGLVSPPLDRHEPDPNLLLYQLYQRLAGDERARDYLRRAVVQLYLDTIGRADGDLLQAAALGRLIGFFQVALRPQIANALRLGLWGLLRDHLARPLAEMMSQEGSALHRAIHALDLWVAVTPPLAAEGTPEVKAQVDKAFNGHLDGIRKRTLGEERFLLLTLSFRALLLIDPKQAGRRGLRDLCRFVEETRNAGPLYEHRWQGTCAELGRALARPGAGEWREAFRRGLLEQPPPDDAEHGVYWDALARLGQAEFVRPRLPDDKAERIEKLAEKRPLRSVS